MRQSKYSASEPLTRFYRVCGRAYGIGGELYYVDCVAHGKSQHEAIQRAFDYTAAANGLTWSEDGVNPPLISDTDLPPRVVEIERPRGYFIRD